ncbi:MAG: ABC transporter permease [Acidimicrobiales bacterium]
MIRLTLNSLWSHKRRLVSTCIAIVLGVAFMAGTFVLTSTINKVFDDLFATGYEGVDAVVRGPVLYRDHHGTQRDNLPESALAEVKAVSGVAIAEGSISTEQITVLDQQGETMGGNGPPTIVGSWESDRQLNPYHVVRGRAPRSAGEAVIDKAGFEEGGFRVGGRIRLVTARGTRPLRLVGVTRFGDADSSGGVLGVQATLPQAQDLIGEANKLETVDVRTAPGVDPETLVQRLEAAKVAPRADVVTGDEAAAEQSQELKGGFVSFFSTILLVFAFIALFVGAFIISNTFGILIAQRTRELALLRAVGASRRQVLTSVLFEAGVIGVVSSVVGFVAGVALAKGALVLLNAFGVDLPSAGITVRPISAVITIAVGLLITASASLLPAIRATRVPPLAALRDVAVDQSGRSRLRLVFGLLLLGAGVYSILPAFGRDPTTDQLPGIGLGLGLVILAVLVLGPTFARPLSLAVGSPLPRLRGITGRLSRENAMRSPRRTASTASALIIGVTLIVFITAFAASAQTSISNSISGGFKGQYIVQPQSQASFTGVSPKLARSLRDVDGVDVVAAASFTPTQLVLPGGAKPAGFVGGIEPSTYGRVFDVKMDTGKLTDLRPGTVVVDRQVAKKQGLRIGQQIGITSASGRKARLEISAISDEPNLLGQWTVSASDAARLSPSPTDAFIGLRIDRGLDLETLRAPLTAVVDRYPTMKLQDRDQFTGSLVDQIKALLNVIYGLLAISVLIALIGIANTLSLSIHERTRELGLLRAMGMARDQLRASVRWEAAIVALMGTVVGVLLGVGASIVMVKALVSQGFTDFQLPIFGILSLATIVVVAVALGVLAAVRPAWRASRLNLLDAIATE